MKLTVLFLLALYFVSSFSINSCAEDLSADAVLQGLKAYSQVDSYPQLKKRQHWMNDMRVKQALMTNAVERASLSKELIQVLNSKQTSNEDKCAAAYLIGLFQLNEGIEALIRNFLLVSKAAMEPDLRPIEGVRPSQSALIKLGKSSLPKIIKMIESTTNTYELKYGAQAILMIKGQKEGSAFLEQAIHGQADENRKTHLRNALLSEYFTDSKYEASGPKEAGAIERQGVE